MNVRSTFPKLSRDYIFPTRPAFSSCGKNFHQRGIVFPESNFPSRAKQRIEGTCTREIRFPEGGNFSRGRKPRPCGTIFSVMEMQIPMDLHKFLPSPDSSVGRVPGYRAKGPRLKSRVLLIVITNDFIIFEFSLLKLKFQEIDLKFCLAPIAQLIERQTVDQRVPGSNPVSCLKLSQTISIIFVFSLLKVKFQEIDMDFCLTLIAQLVKRQTVDLRVPGSNPFSSCLLTKKIIVLVFDLVVLFAKIIFHHLCSNFPLP